MELLKAPVDGETIPATATINRILIKLGLVTPRKRKRPKDSYQRWEQPGAKHGLTNASHWAVEVKRKLAAEGRGEHWQRLRQGSARTDDQIWIYVPPVAKQ
jgi:hypothetical protein